MQTKPRVAGLVLLACVSAGLTMAADAPTPLLKKGKPVDWWFVFKFSPAAFPDCGGGATRVCLTGGQVQKYPHFSQQFAFASSQSNALQQGGGCVGDTTMDPVGATASEVYTGKFFYVVWNDQFGGDPLPDRGGPAGHSKGMLAWDKTGKGFVMQVSTPSWPGSGSSLHPRMNDGNTLGCVLDNNVELSQHFFALKLTKDDTVAVLQALTNAGVVTDAANLQVVNNGGPPDIQMLVSRLGHVSPNKAVQSFLLSTGVTLISKASHLNVPPWQMVSAELDGEGLRVASFWHAPLIPATTTAKAPGCWSTALKIPGPVDIATTGTWMGKTIGLEGKGGTNGNHAKIGVSTSGAHKYAIFGDMNQQGSLDTDCDSSQNGRGGLFFVIDNAELHKSIGDLIAGESGPAH